MDELSRDRLEVDMIKLSGLAFDALDNRLMSLQLVQQRLTNAALFAPDGDAVEPAELLYRSPVLIERGSFRPVTRVGLDMLERSRELMESEPDMAGREPVALMEMTLRNLLTLGEEVEHEDFLARMDTLRALGHTVMISNYSRFHNVTTYLRRYTRERIGMVMGLPTLAQILEEKYYADLDGGILEALGRLLGGGPVRLYVYPRKLAETGETLTIEDLAVSEPMRELYLYLIRNRYIAGIVPTAGLDLATLPHEALMRLRSADPSWEELVPREVVALVKARRLFGYGGRAPRPVI
jgi:hypothetical protein